jgi:diguanylate cyclase (GGDEF)-like protein
MSTTTALLSSGLGLVAASAAAGYVMASHQMRAQLRIDGLTGVANRAGILAALDRRVTATEPFVVVLLDLDGFKKVNDTRGHTSGDRVLVAVADRLRHTTRRRAVIARVGGEESLIAEMTQPGEGQTIAERLRQEVAAIPWGATASVGVASVSRDDAVDLDTRTVVDHLVDAADVAMYEAKRAGGNQTRRAESIEIHSR